MQTVRGKFAEGFTKKEVVKAKEARRLQGMLRGVSEKDFKGLVSSNTLKDNVVSSQAITNPNDLFGRDLSEIHGKTTRIKPDPVVENYVAIPRAFVLANKHMMLVADVFVWTDYLFSSLSLDG